MPKKIVLVDDSKSILNSVGLAFKPLIDSGEIIYEPRLDPAEFFWDLIEGKTSYDLLISDINMPQMSGLELISYIKEEESVKYKPIIVLSTESSQEMKDKGRKLGILGWVVKPFNEERLRRAVKLILGV